MAIFDPNFSSNLRRTTAGRSGASYSNFLTQNPNFDPWSNLDQFAGQGAGNDPIFRFAFAKTNDWARANGYNDGSDIPLAQRQQVFMAQVERARQQWADLGQQQQQGDTGAAAGMQGVTWETSAANRLANSGWSYQPGWGLSHAGQSWETQNQGVPSTTTVHPGTPSQPVTSPDGTTNYRWPDGSLHNKPFVPGLTHTETSGTGASTIASGGGLTAAQKMALGADPDQAYRYMMQQLGYNPDAPGLLGNFLQKRFQPLLEARMAASGLESGDNTAGYLDTIDQIIKGFGGGMVSSGGGNDFFQQLAATGNRAAGGAQPYLDSLKDQSQAMQYLNQIASLRFAGANPLIQQSGADVADRSNKAYQDLSFNTELRGQNIDPFTQWLMTQPQYRGIFGY
jgi:hypothetical protein